MEECKVRGRKESAYMVYFNNGISRSSIEINTKQKCLDQKRIEFTAKYMGMQIGGKYQ